MSDPGENNRPAECCLFVKALTGRNYMVRLNLDTNPVGSVAAAVRARDPKLGPQKIIAAGRALDPTKTFPEQGIDPSHYACLHIVDDTQKK